MAEATAAPRPSAAPVRTRRRLCRRPGADEPRAEERGAEERGAEERGAEERGADMGRPPGEERRPGRAGAGPEGSGGASGHRGPPAPELRSGRDR
ncbi:hypothetical protein C5C18_01615 [Rathayibacter tritici]|nr:hypothetical protein C5C21_02635 [Rathayibacter tritici]PPG09103.1 hypothetical protein C5C18_01615 [Rathayibacter tritici]